MASLLRELLKKPPPPPLRILLSLNNSHLQPPLPPPFLHPNPITKTNPNPPLPCLPDRGGDPPPFRQSLQFYPSFPHGYQFEPISLSGFDGLDAESNGDVGSGDEDRKPMVWADSVKKKRKTKMNKHKYRKLRKRLRRQT